MSTTIRTSDTRVTSRSSGNISSAVRRHPARHSDVWSGVRSMIPWLIGVVPFGMVIGMTARTSDVSTAIGLATGATIYSGSAQLTAIELLHDGASIAVVVASVLTINARLILYSSSISAHWKGTGAGFRAAAAYLLVDPSYVVGMHRYRDERRGAHVHYIAAGITLWVAWQAAMLTGAALGGGLPEWLLLEHAVPFFLLAEVVQITRTRPALTAAMVGGVCAVAGGNLPLHSGLLVGVVAGVVGALTIEQRSS
jgi:predicted branched-subunit amino acid permease